MENKSDFPERALMVYAMEYIARQVNDEEVFEEWLIDGVADGDIEYGDFGFGVHPYDGTAQNGDVEYYVSDERFAELMDTFLRVMSRARKSGGLYCGGIVSK